MRALSIALWTLILSLLISTTTAAADGLSHSEAEARDLSGYEPSLYTGKWHSPRHEQFRRCIMDRESNFNYLAANRTSSARGAYQFLDRSWRIPLTHMMLREDKRTGGYLRDEIIALREISIQKWDRYWQDRAFWTAFRHGDGAHHWHFPGSPCNGLA